MINIDQLRISDDGGSLFIDAHVSKARYFDKVFIDEVTVCTEAQVEKSLSEAARKDYVYKEKVSPEKAYEPLSMRPVAMSGSVLLDMVGEDGGLSVNLLEGASEVESTGEEAEKQSEPAKSVPVPAVPAASIPPVGDFGVITALDRPYWFAPKRHDPPHDMPHGRHNKRGKSHNDGHSRPRPMTQEEWDGLYVKPLQDAPEASGYAVSLLLAGQFSVTGDGVAKIVATTPDYDWEKEGLTGSNVLFTIEGERRENGRDAGKPAWVFRGKGETGGYKKVCLHLFAIGDDGTASHVGFGETDSIERLHLLYHPYAVVENDGKKEIHLVLNACRLNEKYHERDLRKHVFFVYIKASGFPAPDTPCRLDEPVSLGVTFDYGLIYQNALCYTRALTERCGIPDGFVDFILTFEALKLAVETEHYLPAIGYWRRLVEHGCAGKPAARPCGCHG